MDKIKNQSFSENKVENPPKEKLSKNVSIVAAALFSIAPIQKLKLKGTLAITATKLI